MYTDAISFSKRYGPWAIIAGASEGIGRSFAEQLAAQGINLILLSRNRALLDEIACDIRAAHAVEVRCHTLDLIGDDLERCLDDIIRDVDIGLMIYNAGGSSIQSDLFLNMPLDSLRGTLRLNCDGPVIFSHKIGQGLKQRGRGGIILLSSLSAMCGAGYVANYAATKSFDAVLAQGLWAELRGFGVDVLCVMAGATITPAAARMGMTFTQDDAAGAMTADAVVTEALAALGKGPQLIPGEHNRQMIAQLKQLPIDAAVEACSAGTAASLGKPWPAI